MVGSTMEEAWWAAVTQTAFGDGALVIDDSALTRQGGGSADLRVKLANRPRSDVTVALSESSDLITLGSESLTFTPDNWDTFQSVTVTAAGGANRQTFPIRRNNRWSFQTGSIQRFWLASSHVSIRESREVDDALTASGVSRWLVSVDVEDAGRIVGRFGGSATDVNRSASGHDLSAAFEANGSMEIVFGVISAIAPLAGQDTSEPYSIFASPVSDGTALFAALPSTGQQQDTIPEIDFIIRDYTPGSATIGLAASGPDEYDGVTGSAAVTVT